MLNEKNRLTNLILDFKKYCAYVFSPFVCLNLSRKSYYYRLMDEWEWAFIWRHDQFIYLSMKNVYKSKSMLSKKKFSIVILIDESFGIYSFCFGFLLLFYIDAQISSRSIKEIPDKIIIQSIFSPFQILDSNVNI